MRIAATDQIAELVVSSQGEPELVLSQAGGDRHHDGRVAPGAVGRVAGDGVRLPGGHNPSSFDLDRQ